MTARVRRQSASFGFAATALSANASASAVSPRSNASRAAVIKLSSADAAIAKEKTSAAVAYFTKASLEKLRAGLSWRIQFQRHPPNTERIPGLSPRENQPHFFAVL